MPTQVADELPTEGTLSEGRRNLLRTLGPGFSEVGTELLRTLDTGFSEPWTRGSQNPENRTLDTGFSEPWTQTSQNRGPGL